jgi:hypothetical protein
MFEGRYLGAWNLMDDQGNKKDLTLTIARVEADQVVGEGGKSSKKPIVHFQPQGSYQPLPMALNKTNMKTIVAMYGTYDVRQWVGKKITLFGTTTQFGGQEKECIRIRPRIPGEGKADAAK